ncbi:MAG: hypothetical protein LE178_00480 [Endomicrobium sp.]|nr:hypothetical protein [Endomicrobium sp.]
MPKTLYTEFVGIDVSENKLNVYETKNNQFFKDFFHHFFQWVDEGGAKPDGNRESIVQATSHTKYLSCVCRDVNKKIRT